MSSNVLFGKPCTEVIYQALRESAFKGVLYTIGFDAPQWKQYTYSLENSGKKCGIRTRHIYLRQDCAPNEMFETIDSVCRMHDAAGVLLEQPLPEVYQGAANRILPQMDVDCLTSRSIAAMYKGASGIRPATPSAVIRLLDFYDISLSGKHVVVVGRGAVGKPLALMMLARNATVTVCHTKTADLPTVCKTADILVSACGVAGLINKDFVTEKTVVVDVGLSIVDGHSVGDVAPEVCEVCSAVSPVPGGVGPVTRAVVFENLLKISKAK